MNLAKYADIALTQLLENKDLAATIIVLFILAIIVLFSFLMLSNRNRIKAEREYSVKIEKLHKEFEVKLDVEQEKRESYWKDYAIKATHIMEEFIQVKKKDSELLRELTQVIQRNHCNGGGKYDTKRIS